MREESACSKRSSPHCGKDLNGGHLPVVDSKTNTKNLLTMGQTLSPLHYRRCSRREDPPDRMNDSVSATPVALRTGLWLSIGILIVSVVGYLVSVNRNAVSGYAIRQAEKRVSEASETSKKLRIREAELRSLASIEEAGARLNMVPTDHPLSIRATGPIAYR